MKVPQFLDRLIDFRQLPEHPLPDRAWPFIRQISWQLRRVLLPILLLNTLLGLLSGLTPYLWKKIVDPLASPLTGDALAVAVTMPLMIYIGIAIILSYLVRYSAFLLQAATVNTTVAHMIIRQLYHYQLGQSIAVFHDEMSGRLANKVNVVGNRTANLLSTLTENVLRNPVTVITTLTTLLFVSPWLAIPLTGWAIVYVASNIMLLPRVNKLSQRAADASNTTYGRMVDTLSNMMLVKLFAHSGQEDIKIVEVIGNERQRDLESRMGWAGFYALGDFFDLLLEASTLLLVVMLRIRGLITTGDVVMAVALVNTASSNISAIMRNVGTVFDNAAVLDENLKITTKAYSVHDVADAQILPRVRGEIAIDHLSFRYGPDLPDVLHDLSLTIPAGQKVGLIGPSGAGKSTLMQLLLRLYDPTNGRILFDGHDITHVTQDSLRQQIAMVTQDTALLNRSVADNIRYGRPDADDAQVQTAAETAEAHDFILMLREATPDPVPDRKAGLLGRFSRRVRRSKQPPLQPRTGYAAHVGERGVKLSGGQRQRIAIARLILKDAPILILDEATSALDSEVEAAIQGNLTRVMAGRTVIAIAHRLSTIAQLDRLIVLDGGRIVEDGTHAELLANGGIYARLWHRQSGGFLAIDDAK